MTLCYILLPVHNRREITQKFIECLKSQTHQNYKLILIDDGSTDATAEMVKSKISNPTIITGHGNWWWAGSLQQGINWLKAHSPKPQDVILMINDDVFIESDFLAIAIEILQKMPKTLLQAQGYSLQTGICLDIGLYVDFNSFTFNQSNSNQETNCLSTRGLFMRWQDLQQVGNFYPQLLPHYLSDYEFTMRSHRQGLVLSTHPALKLWINEDTSGFHPKGKFRLTSIWERYFSRRSSSNKIDWTMFVLLTCPKDKILINLGRVWMNGIVKLFIKPSIQE
jgi:GT2 family glycosyltransferase